MVKLPFALTWGTLIPGAALVLAVGGVGWAVYDSGYDSGQAHVQSEWDKKKLAQSNEINRLNYLIGGIERTHHNDTVRITDELFKANQAFTAAVGALNAKYVARLLDSEKRAGIYQRLSEAGPAEQARLASHAAKLDRSLEEGRHLVEELRTTVEQCERQLTLLGEQLTSDRQLMGDTDGK